MVSYASLHKSQHTRLNTSCFPLNGPQNFREESCVPTVELEYYVKVPRQNRARTLLLPVPLLPMKTTLILSSSRVASLMLYKLDKFNEGFNRL